MTGNESDPAQDPDKTVFDPDNVFGSGAGDGDKSPDSSHEPDNIWGPFTGETAPDHSTQVLESDAFGRPFLPEGGSDPFGSSDPGAGDLNLWSPGGDGDTEASSGDAPDAGQWSPPGFGDQPAEPTTHMEHEVPPPWEVEPGAPGPWSPPAADDQQQPWQPTPDNGQQPWQQPQGGFDPFAGQQPDGSWSPGGPGPGDSPFGQSGPFGGPAGGQQDGPWSPGGPGDSPFGQSGPFGGPDGGQQGGTEVPNPFAVADFGPADSTPSPFESAPFGDQDPPTADQPQGESPFGEQAPSREPDTSAGDGDPSPFWPPQSDDEHSTDVLPKPSGSEPGQFEQPWSPQGDPSQGNPWGQWPGETGQSAPQQPPMPQQPQAPRYDLSQFQQGYQPPQAPPQQQQQPPPQQDQQFFQGFPPQQPPQQQGHQQFQQYPNMAPPLQLPPQSPIPLTSENLSPQALLKPRKAPPTSGWRRAVFKVSGGVIDPGESNKEIQRQQMVSLVRTPVAGGHYRVAVLSLKGGVGKTTTTVGLGSTLASLRGDRIIAVDANPDRGTLSEKVRLETRANVRDLLANKEAIQRYSDVRQYTSQAASRLEVLASDPDPAISEAFSEDDYRSIADVLEHYYSICLTDCGTGLLHSAMRGVLGLADQIVLVSSASVDGARSASATLDWLDAHDYGDLVQSGVVVMSAVRPQNKAVDLSRLEQHFSARCRALVRIPFDPHLEAGAEFVLEQLSAPTRDAYLELTAAVAAGFQYRLPT